MGDVANKAIQLQLNKDWEVFINCSQRDGLEAIQSLMEIIFMKRLRFLIIATILSQIHSAVELKSRDQQKLNHLFLHKMKMRVKGSEARTKH